MARPAYTVTPDVPAPRKYANLGKRYEAGRLYRCQLPIADNCACGALFWGSRVHEMRSHLQEHLGPELMDLSDEGILAYFRPARSAPPL